MHKEYFQEYYHLERNNWWFKARKNILISQIRRITPQNKKLKILNVGIATGASTEWLSKFGEVASVEYDEEVCVLVREKLKIDVIHASITNLPFEDDAFDLVCAFDVIEHVDDDGKAVQEMKRVCKGEGYVFITVPAYMHLWSEHDEINFHKRRYTKNALLKFLKKYGLSHIVFSTYFNTFLYPLIFLLRIAGRLKSRKSKPEELQSDFSKFNFKPIEKILFNAFYSENHFLKRGAKFPFGVSILAIAKK